MTYVRTRCGADGQPRYTAYFHDARGRERSAGTYPLLREAREAAFDAQARVLDGRFLDRAAGRSTFERYVTETWLPNLTFEATTQQGYAYVVHKYLLEFFGPIRMSELMPGAVREFYALLSAAGIGTATLHKCKTVLCSIFNTAVNDRIVARHPCAGVPVPPDPQRLRKVISPTQYLDYPPTPARPLATADRPRPRQRLPLGRTRRAPRQRPRPRPLRTTRRTHRRRDRRSPPAPRLRQVPRQGLPEEHPRPHPRPRRRPRRTPHHSNRTTWRRPTGPAVPRHQSAAHTTRATARSRGLHQRRTPLHPRHPLRLHRRRLPLRPMPRCDQRLPHGPPQPRPRPPHLPTPSDADQRAPAHLTQLVPQPHLATCHHSRRPPPPRHHPRPPPRSRLVVARRRSRPPTSPRNARTHLPPSRRTLPPLPARHHQPHRPRSQPPNPPHVDRK
jgi:hypothetical protein